MPSIATWVPETLKSITRPVALGVVRDLAAKLGMNPNLQIIYPGASEQIAQPGSNMTQNPMNNNYWPNSERIFVEVSEPYQEAKALATPVFRADNPFCFGDPRVHTFIKPVYSGTEMVLALRYHAPDRTTAERWRDDIRIRYSRGRVENLHTINYSYGIPYAFLEILQEVSTLKEAVDPYGETFLDWVRAHLSPKGTVLVDQAGNNPLLSIAETQQIVIGWFDFDFAPESPQKDGDTGACTVSFEYHIEYDKPVQCAMHYPLMVHNQLISSRFRDSNVPYQLSAQQIDPSMSRKYFNGLTPGLAQKPLPSLPWLRVPSYDDWQPPTDRWTLSTLATFMLQVDDSNPFALVNLNALGDYEIDPDILTFLAGEGPYLGVFGQSIFNFTLFEEYTPLPDGHMTWDSAYNLGYDHPLDRTQRYHLRWGVINDLSLLSPAALGRLATHGTATLKILQALGDSKDPCVQAAPLPSLTDGQLTLASLRSWMVAVNQCRARRVGINNHNTLPLTVGAFLINARPATAASTT